MLLAGWIALAPICGAMRWRPHLWLTAAAGAGKALPPDAKGGRTHVVQKGDTLYKLARQYYGSEKRWKEIWEANKTRVPNKDKLEVGTKLIIP
jgi:nucleoid-associated protein YgaU